MRKNLVHLIPGKHDRQPRRFLRPFHPLQPAKFLFEHFFIKKKQRAQRLVLGRGSNLALASEMRQEGAHLGFSHFPGMAHSVETDKALDPIPISPLCAQAVMLEAHDIAHLFDQLWIWLALKEGIWQKLSHDSVLHGR